MHKVKNCTPRSFRSIIDRWPRPSIASFADEIGVPYVTAQLMRYRNSIGPGHWPAVVAAAQCRGFTDISHELLAELRVARFKRAPRELKRGGNDDRPPSEAVAA